MDRPRSKEEISKKLLLGNFGPVERKRKAKAKKERRGHEGRRRLIEEASQGPHQAEMDSCRNVKLEEQELGVSFKYQLKNGTEITGVMRTKWQKEEGLVRERIRTKKAEDKETALGS
ncbi:unnamed protein product [Nezara viridula]|uniref:Uncharacterized protein n=1 Tax=Nezara viridula TaxID=85310 RepID=A0A9P0HU10_NEZVI|nr:unnamed protein product [Nezara viridula]